MQPSSRRLATLPGAVPVQAVLVFAMALLASLPLILNPGYFSHDELQWAVFAERGQAFPWLGIDAFQYRPLTFNLWAWLSRHLFAQPQAFHAVLAAWGAGNVALLYAVGRGFGVGTRPAVAGALAFALSPYAVYVHGWVGTLGDLAWLSCALLIGLLTMHTRSVVIAALVAATLTAIGLLGKEAAFAIPPLLAVAWWFDGRKPTWAAATLAAGAIAAAYLALRWNALLHAPREGVQYTLSLANAPLRWVEYQLFPPIIPLLEAFTTFLHGIGAHIVIATVLWLGLFAALWKAGRRYAAVFVLGGVAALLPVLPMGRSWTHYAYAFAAVGAMCIAAAWPRTTRWGRVAIGAFALLSVLHGANVMRLMRHVGEVQAVFSPALAAAVRDHDGVVRLRPVPGAKEWIFQRLTHEIPSYRGIPIGDRVQLVGAGEPADYVILADGHLQALR
ncbi:hypothetical protein [Lysobacter sp. CFH 32150]|uniref:hypothetical protein n=1 Tax=Lysobacter sp. CFH 32150 TaxID=2927128 RepID=UPI001FA749F2|nr:hypothetical protein [Lysobacter sp. CFH 32150]MCI4568538.1 hypothetical protein [Lysobacter sp. CFH 32150]